MPDFWDSIKALFSKAEMSSPSNPLIHEMIERSEKEQADYTHWKETLVCRRLNDWLFDQYAVYQVAPDDIDQALDFLDTPSSKGFVIHFDRTRYSKRDVTHYFDFLKEQVLTLNYRTQISDRRTYNRPQWVEMVERHYLKPRTGAYQEGQKFHQQYGNITIESQWRDEQPFRLKFQATAYHDRLFHDAEEFKGLIRHLAG